ncbi:1,5-anhydro-D-fructose reductase-like [Homalodisca vitripennis]|uniref:1,5-anhydro-D-fructose reductase-like n=1 Tax=Homalodisca vitripennis TaxID=197043 RepID=UPI001EEB79EC|nr:1,5-anhydro-D-fructose reductase-like [Homalodisca vitripennis]
MSAKLTKDSVFTATSGMRMPVVGLGTLARSTEERSSDEDITKAVEYALEAGYRHFDTAYMYRNEKAVGNAFKKWLDSGKIKREDLFVVTKLPMVGNNEKLVERYLKESLEDLQLSYVDLYLIHKPVGFQPGKELFPTDENGYLKLDYDTDHIALWKAMEAQVDAGRAKFIGLSDFTIAQMERILKIARIRPSTDQVECHLYFQRKELREWGKKNGIPVTSFATLGSGAAVSIFDKGGNMTEQQKKNPLTEEVVIRIAQAHGKSPGQVLLRHMVQLGVAVIPKSSHPDRIKQNIDIFDFELTDKDMADLGAFDLGEGGRKFFVSNLVKGYDKHPECPYGKP